MEQKSLGNALIALSGVDELRNGHERSGHVKAKSRNAVLYAEAALMDWLRFDSHGRRVEAIVMRRYGKEWG